MTKTEIIQFLDDAIRNEILLGPARDHHCITGYRNIKTDFNYIASKNFDMDAVDIIKKLYTERVENAQLYKDNDKIDLWIQEETERKILRGLMPAEPKDADVIDFLNSLVDVPKQKSSFRQFQDACSQKFGQKVNSKLILDFIEKS